MAVAVDEMVDNNNRRGMAVEVDGLVEMVTGVAQVVVEDPFQMMLVTESIWS